MIDVNFKKCCNDCEYRKIYWKEEFGEFDIIKKKFINPSHATIGCEHELICKSYIESKNYIFGKDETLSKTANWEIWAGWVGNHNKRIEDAKCSNCGYKHPTVYESTNQLSRYCPNCNCLMSVLEEG